MEIPHVRGINDIQRDLYSVGFALLLVVEAAAKAVRPRAVQFLLKLDRLKKQERTGLIGCGLDCRGIALTVAAILIHIIVAINVGI